MEDVKGLGSAATMDAQGKEIMRVEKDRDQVQEWWEDIIEML